jgi:hypothetical protein
VVLSLFLTLLAVNLYSTHPEDPATGHLDTGSLFIPVSLNKN